MVVKRWPVTAPVWAYLLVGCWLGQLAAAFPAAGHGAMLEYRRVPAVVVEARYESGQPMAGAGVAVFAPDDPTRPWLTGTSDEAGRFSFVPDPERVGVWAVQARLGGHGAMAHIEIGAAPGPAAGDGPAVVIPAAAGPDPLQRWVMALAVVWGLVGTALFFARRVK